jgi:hypothetical protein
MAGIKMYLKRTVLFGLVTVLVSACLSAPEFSHEPAIGFYDIIFKHGATEFDQDSLILTITFQDGNGDLGLAPDGADTWEPYHDLTPFPHVNESRFVQLFDRNTAEYDTLPPYEFPYTCTNYYIFETDTFYVQPNEFHNNIYVTFFVKKNGEYTEFDFLELSKPQCNLGYDGRYPRLNDPNRDRPLEGKLKYKMKSAAWELFFRQDTLKLDVFIYDRELNKSNMVSTPDFVLKNITVGG